MCCHEDFIICNIGEVIRYCCLLTIWFDIHGETVCFFIFFKLVRSKKLSLEISEVFYKCGIYVWLFEMVRFYFYLIHMMKDSSHFHIFFSFYSPEDKLKISTPDFSLPGPGFELSSYIKNSLFYYKTDINYKETLDKEKSPTERTYKDFIFHPFIQKYLLKP